MHLGKIVKQLILEHRDSATSKTHYIHRDSESPNEVTTIRTYHTPGHMGDLEVTNLYDYFTESWCIFFDLTVNSWQLPSDLVAHLETEPFIIRSSDKACLIMEKINEKEIRLFVEI